MKCRVAQGRANANYARLQEDQATVLFNALPGKGKERKKKKEKKEKEGKKRR